MSTLQFQDCDDGGEVVRFVSLSSWVLSGAEVASVRSGIRAVASALSGVVRRPTRVTWSRDGRVAIACPVGHDYRLEVSSGVYSTLRGMPPGENVRDWVTKRDAAPREVVFDVRADAEWLRDGSFATEGIFGAEYTYLEFREAGEVSAWLREHVLSVPVDRIPPEDIEKWRERAILANGVDGGRIRVSLAEAVKIYGSIYREMIDAKTLARNHQIAPEDASAIAEAVRRVLPRRRA